jgi:DUF1016 N-terminal domain
MVSRTKSKRLGSAAVPSPAAKSVGYQALLKDIKSRIRKAQIKASLAVNRELIQLYWDIGGLIVNRQRAEGWGKSVVEKLASDIQKDFPGIEGFSPRNLWRMRAFYLAWVHSEAMPLAVGKRERKRLPRAVADLESQFLPQPVAARISSCRTQRLPPQPPGNRGRAEIGGFESQEVTCRDSDWI